MSALRFTSAFISTLLLASTVLADGFYPYAGYRVEKSTGWLHLHDVSARFNIPEMEVVRNDDIAYLGVTLGDPILCNGAIEAGVTIRRNVGEDKVEYVAYWQLHPGPANFLSGYDFKLQNQVSVAVHASRSRDGVIRVIIQNLRPGAPTHGEITVGDVSHIWNCLRSATWGLRANYQLDVGLYSFPEFTRMLMYGVKVVDLDYNVYTLLHAKKVTMVHSDGVSWSEPVPLDFSSFWIYHSSEIP